MLTLTTPDSSPITADTHVQLATLWADQLNGPGWNTDASPFDEHTTIWDLVEQLHDIEDNAIPGYRITPTNKETCGSEK